MRNTIPKCRYCKFPLKKDSRTDMCFSCEVHTGVITTSITVISMNYHTNLKSKQYWTDKLESALELKTK